MGQVLWKAIEYLAGDKLKSGFVLQRALLKIMGLFWWEKPSLIKRFVITLESFNKESFNKGSKMEEILGIYSFLFLALQIVGFISVCTYTLRNTQVRNTEEFTAMISNLVVIMSFSFAIFKLVNVHWNSRHFKSMIESLEDFPEDGVVWSGKRMMLMNIATIVMVDSGWLFNGVTNDGNYYDCDMPWDTTTDLGHFLSLLLQLLMSTPASVTLYMMDALPFSAVERLVPQIRHLKQILSQIGPHMEDNKRLTRKAAKLHTAIIRSIYLINRSFRGILLFQVICLVPFICLCAFMVVKILEIHFILAVSFPVTVLMVMQLYMYCGAGQLLASEMENMDHICYDNKWYRAPVYNRKELSIIMECSRRNATVNAYGVAYANNATLLAVLQQGYTYFLFLLTMAEQVES